MAGCVCGGGGHAWQGACMTRRNVHDKAACMAGGEVCMAGGGGGGGGCILVFI